MLYFFVPIIWQKTLLYPMQVEPMVSKLEYYVLDVKEFVYSMHAMVVRAKDHWELDIEEILNLVKTITNSIHQKFISDSIQRLRL